MVQNVSDTSQGSAASHLRRGGISNDEFIINLLENRTVKKF